MIHQILLLFSIFPAIIHSKNSCPISTCNFQNNNLHIKYPFQLQTDHPPKHCNIFIKLICDTQGQVVINLPSVGNFYVKSIDYDLQMIVLTDPGNCLLGRLMMMSNISPYPLEAYTYKNYTYYTCPMVPVSHPFTEIRCLSNSVNATVATAALSSKVMRKNRCTPIASSMLPVSWSNEYSFSDLQLTWDPLYSDDSKSKLDKFLQSSAFIGSAAVLVTFSGLACLLRISKIISGRASNTVEDVATTESSAATSTTVAPPQATVKSQVKNFSEVVILGESQGTSVTCSICLEEYSDKDRVRILDQCGHYFHVQCIDEWLQKNNSCPVCRTSSLS